MDNWLAIFRPGTHIAKSGKKRTWTEAEVAQIADNYSQTEERAAITIGHPENDATPAFGWIDGLKVENGVLYAKPGQVHEGLKEAIKAGHYTRLSSGLRRKVDGTWELDHLAVLGAVKPAVTGLGELQFSADVEEYDAGLADKQTDVPEWIMSRIERLEERLTNNSPSNFSTSESTMTEQEMQQRIQQLEAENAQLKTETRSAEFSAFVASEAVKTRVVPAQRDRVLRIMSALDGQEQYEFSQDNKTIKATALEEFQAFLKELPEQYTKGETATHSKGATATGSQDLEYQEGLAIAKAL